MTELWLPFPVSVNNLFAAGSLRGRNRRFPSPRYRQWRNTAEALIMASRVRPVKGPVAVSLHLTAPDKRPRDADNYNKSVLDSLVRMRVIDGDDSRTVRRVTAGWENAERPGVRVVIEPTA